MQTEGEKAIKPLEIYKNMLARMSQYQEVRHICDATNRFGDKAVALFTLLFDDVNFFSGPDDPDIVAARIIMYLKESK